MDSLRSHTAFLLKSAETFPTGSARPVGILTSWLWSFIWAFPAEGDLGLLGSWKGKLLCSPCGELLGVPGRRPQLWGQHRRQDC